jgi:hypothetical protein
MFRNVCCKARSKVGCASARLNLNGEIAQMFEATAVVIATGLLAVEAIEVRPTCNQFPAGHRD